MSPMIGLSASSPWPRLSLLAEASRTAACLAKEIKSPAHHLCLFADGRSLRAFIKLAYFNSRIGNFTKDNIYKRLAVLNPHGPIPRLSLTADLPFENHLRLPA
jgi:hypothetical protein